MATTEPMRIPGDVVVGGNFQAKTFTLPTSSVTDTNVATGANISYLKLTHMVLADYAQDSGADVATKTNVIYCCRSTLGAVVFDVAVVVDTAPTGGDKAYTVDIKRSTGGGAFSSILTGVVTVNSSSTTRSVNVASISGTTYTLVQGDILEAVVTASGSTGSQGQGVRVVARVAELGY